MDEEESCCWRRGEGVGVEGAAGAVMVADDGVGVVDILVVSAPSAAGAVWDEGFRPSLCHWAGVLSGSVGVGWS